GRGSTGCSSPCSTTPDSPAAWPWRAPCWRRPPGGRASRVRTSVRAGGGPAARARLWGPDIDPGRRENRLHLGLLRYVSRAALKLSPFSTLTRIALVSLDTLDGDAAEPLAWTGGGWSERSLLRLRRYLIEQDLELLCRYRPFREGLTLRPSSTLEPGAPGSYRLIRPERWTVDAEAGRLRHQSASRVEMHLPGALVERVFAALAGGAGIYGEAGAPPAPAL